MNSLLYSTLLWRCPTYPRLGTPFFDPISLRRGGLRISPYVKEQGIHFVVYIPIQESAWRVAKKDQLQLLSCSAQHLHQTPIAFIIIVASQPYSRGSSLFLEAAGVCCMAGSFHNRLRSKRARLFMHIP